MQTLMLLMFLFSLQYANAATSYEAMGLTLYEAEWLTSYKAEGLVWLNHCW